MLTKKIVLINCYFGQFPNYFDLFLESCRYNANIDFLFFTDQEYEDLPANVRFVKYTFEEFRNYVQSKFDFSICLDNPYKLCDYKPAYGYILQDYIGNYDFWGHCDIDLIFGKVSDFLSDDILERFDKIYQLGHLCLYRNTTENNSRFMSDVGMNYKDVFTTSIIKVFDEMIGMQDKFNRMGLETYKKRDMIDISPVKYRFDRVDSWLTDEEKKTNNYKYQVFYWENGRIYKAYYQDGVKFDEYIYIHFPKRKMDYDKKEIPFEAPFYITNRGFMLKERDVSLDDIKKYANLSVYNDCIWTIRHNIFKWKRRFNKYIMKR